MSMQLTMLDQSECGCGHPTSAHDHSPYSIYLDEAIARAHSLHQSSSVTPVAASGPYKSKIAQR